MIQPTRSPYERSERATRHETHPSRSRPPRERLRILAPYDIVEHVAELRGDGELTTLEAIDVLATAEAHREMASTSREYRTRQSYAPHTPRDPDQQRGHVAELLNHYSTQEAFRRSGLPRTTFYRIARAVRQHGTTP